MVSIKAKEEGFVISVDMRKLQGKMSPKMTGEFADFLEEQAEIWLNQKNLSKEFKKISKEKSVPFKFE